MKIKGMAAVAAVAAGIGGFVAAPASATDNIRAFGEEETLIGGNGQPYIGYTVSDFGPSNDPVPHNGKLFSAKLFIDGYGGNTDPMIGRFGARAQNGTYYPSIGGASNFGVLYFDVVGVEPNSVVWNDGIRDILAWIPGEPMRPAKVLPPPPVVAAPPPPVAEAPPVAADTGAMPVESDPALVATPNDLAQPAPELSEAEVASPGFNR